MVLCILEMKVNSANQINNDFLVVDPTVKEILDLMLDVNARVNSDKIVQYAQKLSPKNGRGQALVAKWFTDMRNGSSFFTCEERLELLELLVSAEGY